MPLATRELGAGPAAVIAHGLFGSGRNWLGIARQLSRAFRVLLPDLRNHGNSPQAARMNYETHAADLAALVQARDVGPAVFVGHSMGGKAVMQLALSGSVPVRALVVVDIAPVPYPDRQRGLIDSLLALPVAALTSRAQADATLATRIADPTLRQFLLQNLERRGHGFAWRIDLEAIKGNLAEILDFPATSRRVECPALFIAGARSHADLPRDWPQVLALFPRATLVVIDDAGHWVHADAPEEFMRHLESFLARCAH